MDQDFTILGKNKDRLVQIKIKDLRVWENVNRKKKTWIEEKVANRTTAHSIVSGSKFVEAMYHFVVSRFAVTHFGVPLSADCGCRLIRGVTLRLNGCTNSYVTRGVMGAQPHAIGWRRVDRWSWTWSVETWTRGLTQ